MNSNLINQSLKFCSVLDSQEEFDKSDRMFKLAINIMAQSKGYDPQNPLTPFTDPTTVERSEGIPGSGLLFLDNDLLGNLIGVPDRFKNIKMQDFTAWLSTLVPFFNPNNPVEIGEFRRRIFPNLIRRDPAFWADFKELMRIFNAYILEKALPESITGDPIVDQKIKDDIRKNALDIVNDPIMSVINSELDRTLIP